MRFQAQRGTEDVLPSVSHQWITLENAFRDVVKLYGYAEIRTPTFEDTQLFTRSAGETSDIVNKQMYTFEDRGGRSITLKPEGTAPALRALIEGHVLQQGQATRVSYITAAFRYERPQKGRLRESHQVGIELVGSGSVEADGEVIEIASRFYAAIGLHDVTVLINSLGRSECRDAFRAALLEFAQPLLKDMDAEERTKAERNPLRLLDSKDPLIAEFLKDAPSIGTFWEPESAARMDALQQLLADAGVNWRLTPTIVRGLDYYTETVFEVQADNIGAQSALCGGGRYDNLVKELGGPDMPSVGFGAGIERALLTLEAAEKSFEAARPDVYIVDAGVKDRNLIRRIARNLRSANLVVEYDMDGKTVKAQFKAADRSRAKWGIVIGGDEEASGQVTLKNLDTTAQISISHDQLVEQVKTR